MKTAAEVAIRILLSPIPWILLALTVLVLILRQVYFALRSRALERVEYERSFSVDGTFCGNEVQLTEEIRNPTWFPLFFVEISFFAPDGLCFDGVERKGYQRLRSVFQLLPYSRAVRTHTVKTLRRERYRLELAEIIWRGNSYEFSVPAELSVYPASFDAPIDILPDSHRLGDRLAANRYIEDPYFVSGIREYRAGDAMRSINFKASARTFRNGTRQWMCHACDSSRNFDAMVLLDLTPYPEVCSTLDNNRALVENGLRLACYLLRETVRNGGRYGFVANIEALTYEVGHPFVFVPCGTGNLHMKNVLETFAAIPVYRTAREYSFRALMKQQRMQIPRDMDVYLLSAGTDVGHAALIRELEQAGNSVTFVRVPVTERTERKTPEKEVDAACAS